MATSAPPAWSAPVLRAAAASNVAGGVLMLARAPRDVPGAVLITLFAAVYWFAAGDPAARRGWVVAGALAKTLGAVSGIQRLTTGKRDRLAAVGLVDGAWLPVFAVIAKGGRG